MAVATEWGKTGSDVDKFTSFLAPNARLSYWGAPAIEGIEAIRRVIGPLMKTPGFKMTWQPTHATVAASGDLGYTIGTFTMIFQNANGMLITENGKQQTIWKKVDGEWKVVEDTGTSNAPLPVLSQPVMVPATDLKWTDAPAFLHSGAKMAVLVGDPSKAEPFSETADAEGLPDRAAHTPDRRTCNGAVRTFVAGMGNAWDEKAMGRLAPGSYAVMSANMPHFAMASGTTVVQVHGVGPFVVNYVNPAHDPSKKQR